MAQQLVKAKDAIFKKLGVGSSNVESSIQAVILADGDRRWKIIHRGWLEKKGDLRKKWLKRYVVMVVPRTLFYFKTEEGANAFLAKSPESYIDTLKKMVQGSVPMNSGSVITKVGKLEDKKDNKDNVFTVKPKADNKRVFTFAAESKESMDEWLKMLEEGDKIYAAKAAVELEKKIKEIKEAEEKKAAEEKKLKDEISAIWVTPFLGGSIKVGDVTWQYIEGKISDGQRTWKWIPWLDERENDKQMCVQEPDEDTNQGHATFWLKRNSLAVQCFTRSTGYNMDGSRSHHWTHDDYVLEEKNGKVTYTQKYNDTAKWEWKNNEMTLIEGKVTGPTSAKVTGSVPHPLVMWCLASAEFTPRVATIRKMCTEYNNRAHDETARRQKCIDSFKTPCPVCSSTSRGDMCYNCGASTCNSQTCNQGSLDKCCGAFSDKYWHEPNDDWKRKTIEELMEAYRIREWYPGWRGSS